MPCRVLCSSPIGHVFLIFLGRFHLTEVRQIVSYITWSTNSASSQGIRNNIQEQNNRRLLWGSGVSEISYVARVTFCRAAEVRRPLSAPDQHFQPVRDHRRPPVYDSPEFDWHCVWFVVSLVPTVGVEF